MPDNKVDELLAASAAAIANAKPNTGEGFQGEWPEPGKRAAYYEGVSFEAGEFETKTAGKFPCIEVEFSWTYFHEEEIEGPLFNPDYRLSFTGKRFQLIPDLSVLPAQDGDRNTLGIARMNWDRFVGHASKLLGWTPDQCRQPLKVKEALQELANADTRTTVYLNIEYSPSKKGAPWKTEYVKERTS